MWFDLLIKFVPFFPIKKLDEADVFYFSHAQTTRKYWSVALLFLIMQAENHATKALAAAKVCELKDEDELEDFMTEIDILTSCKHPNIVALYEAFFYGGKLWVSCWFRLNQARYFVMICFTVLSSVRLIDRLMIRLVW